LYFKQIIPALLFLYCISAQADAIEHIEVIGEQFQRQSIGDVNLKHYNGFESVVTRAAFEDRFVSLSDLINELPSVQTFSTGGIGAYSSASIRGSTGKQVNIFVDGILLSSPLSGMSNLGVIPTSIIEAIEIYPDYTPVQLSDGNLAGAINIRTRKLVNGDTGGKISLGYGSFNTYQTEASIWGGNNNTDVIVAGSLLTSENNYPVSADLFPNVSSGTSNERENSAFEQANFFGKLRHTLNNQLFLQFTTSYSNSDNELPTIQNKTEPAATFTTESIRNSLGIESDNADNNWGVRVYNNYAKNTFKDTGKSISLSAQHVSLNEKTLGSTIYTESQLSDNVINFSLDGNHADIEKHNEIGAKESLEATRNKLTAAISDVWTPIKPLAFYALLRGYHVEDESEAGTASFRAGCSTTNRSCLNSTHNETSLQLGSSFQINNLWLIKSNIGQLIRIPTLSEKYGDLGNYIGDPDLKPETSNNIDAGINFKNAIFNAEMVLFYKEIHDGIYVSYDARGVGHPSNISESQITGIELNSIWFMTDTLSLSLSGYAMDSENLSNIKANNGKKLHGIYHNGYMASLIWCNDAHSIITSYQTDDELYYTPSNSVKADKKDSLNVSYVWNFQAWTLNIGVNNILDNQYSDFNRMPTMGRYYNSSIHYEF
jgi:iron complex outermembrane receptor protein